MNNLIGGNRYTVKVRVVNESTYLGTPVGALLFVNFLASIEGIPLASGLQSYLFSPGEVRDFNFDMVVPLRTGGAVDIVASLIAPDGREIIRVLRSILIEQNVIIVRVTNAPANATSWALQAYSYSLPGAPELGYNVARVAQDVPIALPISFYLNGPFVGPIYVSGRIAPFVTLTYPVFAEIFIYMGLGIPSPPYTGRGLDWAQSTIPAGDSMPYYAPLIITGPGVYTYDSKLRRFV